MFRPFYCTTETHIHTPHYMIVSAFYFSLFVFVRASRFVSVLCLPLCAFDFANDEVVRIFSFICVCALEEESHHVFHLEAL